MTPILSLRKIKDNVKAMTGIKKLKPVILRYPKSLTSKQRIEILRIYGSTFDLLKVIGLSQYGLYTLKKVHEKHTSMVKTLQLLQLAKVLKRDFLLIKNFFLMGTITPWDNSSI
jgi:hypothetical protein